MALRQVNLLLKKSSPDRFLASQQGSINHRHTGLSARTAVAGKRGLITPPKRFGNEKTAADLSIVQRLRMRIRKKSLEIWKETPDAEIFHSQNKMAVSCIENRNNYLPLQERNFKKNQESGTRKIMRTAILTQPLHNNYGGLLQAYALQTVLKRLGHDTRTVDLPFRDTAYIYIKGCIIRIILKFIFRRDITEIFPCRPDEKEKNIISKYTKEFVREHIRTTERIPSVKHLKKLKKYNFEAFVVGSDQVWRPRYSPGISAYFLDFLDENSQVRRIAYAASFGVDHWEYNPALTRKCKKLAQKFDAVSVREDSAVELCRENFGVTAVRLLDPALLLEKEDYEKLINDRVPAKEKYLMHYLLDQSAEKTAIVDRVNDHLQLKLLTVMPQCIYPPVTAWLKGISDAEFVVTDSFHGIIFSIIFNRPFLAVGNKDRGLTRFTSLLKTLDLQYRLISDISEVDEALSKPVNFDRVNKILGKEKIMSMDFLRRNLSS
jgi:hypothetical protein